MLSRRKRADILIGTKPTGVLSLCTRNTSSASPKSNAPSSKRSYAAAGLTPESCSTGASCSRLTLTDPTTGPTRRSPRLCRAPPPRWSRERRRFCEEGLEVALMPRKPGRPRRRVLDGRAEAHLVALSCSEPPEGRERWSLRLLADRMVELGYADELSYETVRRTLKETVSSLTSNVSGCSLRGRARLSCGGWKRFWTSTKSLTTPCDRWSASTRGPANS